MVGWWLDPSHLGRDQSCGSQLAGTYQCQYPHMLTTEGPAFRLATALAIGLLMGAERERRKGEGPRRSPAGIRTFAVAALAGGVSYRLGGELLLAVTTLALAGFCAVAYWRGHDKDPGLTSETARLLAALLGGLAQVEIAIASGIAVVVTILLAARTPLHHFVRAVLSENRRRPTPSFCGRGPGGLAPDSEPLPGAVRRDQSTHHLEDRDPDDLDQRGRIYRGPVGGRTFRTAGGRLCVGICFQHGDHRCDGGAGGAWPRWRVEPWPARCSQTPPQLSTALVLAAISPPVLRLLRLPLIAAGIVATAYGALLMLLSARHRVSQHSHPGRAFSLKTALGLGGTIAVVLLLSAALNAWFGEGGALAAAAIAGFADTHSAAVSVASLVAANKMAAREAVLPILAGTHYQHRKQGCVCQCGWRTALCSAGGSGSSAYDRLHLVRTGIPGDSLNGQTNGEIVESKSGLAARCL